MASGRAWFAIAWLAALGCGAPRGVAPRLEEPIAAAPYTVHEWGVVDVVGSGRARLGSGAPISSPTSGIVREPILYFHLDPGAGPLDVDVDVRLPMGEIYESFPPTQAPPGSRAHWPLTLTPGHCSTVPGNGAGCSAPDGICEVPSLGRFDVPSADCVRVGSTDAGMLFYRAAIAPSLPLFARSVGARVDVTATRSMAGAPGGVLYVETGLGGTFSARASFPPPGATVRLPPPTSINRVDEEGQLARDLRELGLDESETAAFIDGWAGELFGCAGAPAAATHIPPAPERYLIYFLSEPQVSELSELNLEPAPRAVRRAFLVRHRIAP